MLQVEGISKKLGNFWLKDISFYLPKGYIMGLIGPNGAGKTTLIHMLLGLTTPNIGSIKIAGRNFEEYERENKDLIGYVLEERLFQYPYSLRKLATYYGKFYSLYEPNLFEHYAREFELDINKKADKLSKGESIKFQCAFALAHHPKLLILDEPTANFDPEFRTKFFSMLSQFIADGEHSVLFATHLTRELDRLADYITFIHKGELIFSKDRETLLEEYRLVTGEAYKINLIKKQQVIYKESGRYCTKALVKGGRYEAYDKALMLQLPTLEDIMYYTVKGMEK